MDIKSLNMKYFINLFLVLVSIVVAHLTAIYVGMFYDKLFPNSIGSGGVFLTSKEFGYYMAVFVAAYLFCVCLSLTTFGGKGKYWWIGVLLIPAVVFEIYFDFSHIYFPIILGLGGWGLGYLTDQLIKKSKKAV